MRHLWALLVLSAILWAGCDSERAGEDPSLVPTCGDGICTGVHCENQVRCPQDCGTCQGLACNVETPARGTCGFPCESSCDCAQTEVCDADFTGAGEGTCVPLACGACSSEQVCDFTPDANDLCPTGSCRQR
jgi:hypothetical protein